MYLNCTDIAERNVTNPSLIGSKNVISVMSIVYQKKNVLPVKYSFVCAVD